jgi:hypothetical protein
METELRLTIVVGGLPKLEAQVSLHDDRGRFLGRVDLYTRRRSSPSSTTARVTETVLLKTADARTVC